MDLQEYFEEKKAHVDAYLNRLIPQPDGARESVMYQAMLYGVNSGGKRLRPVLFLTAMEAFGEDALNFLPFACALEMIHTYSLIHDDLPAMDNDDLRRGKPTCHKVFGEAQAILAGDALLTYAFNAMLQVRPFADSERLLAAIDEVAYQAGIGGMVAGQVVDVQCSGQCLSIEELQYIHEKKTGALFAAAIVSAAILAGVSKMKIEALRVYAMNLGRAYQIADDIRDVIGSPEKTGKLAGSDAKNKKTSYPSLLGLEQSLMLSEAVSGEAVEALALFGAEADILRSLPYYFLHHCRVLYNA